MHRLGGVGVDVGAALLAVVAVCTTATAPMAWPATDEAPSSSPTATVRDLGALDWRSRAVDVDGDLVVGDARVGDRDHAVAIDLAEPGGALRDLGTLGGPESQATAVDEGIVVGSSSAGQLTTHAFAVDLSADDPVMQDLGTLGGDRSHAVAVDGGIVVGWSRTTPARAGKPAGGRAPVWEDAHAFAVDLSAADPVMQDLGTLGGGSSEAAAIEGTVVVGTAATGAGQHAFALDLSTADPVMQDLGTLGGRSSQAVAISDGVVVGVSRTAAGPRHAFAYELGASDPVMRDLGTLGGDGSVAAAISHGTVVGRSQTRQGPAHAFAYDLGSPGMRDLGTLGGGDSAAVDIDGDLVTGLSYVPVGGRHAFVYDLSRPEEGIQDLRPVRGTYSEALAAQGSTVVGVSETDRNSTHHATAWVLGRTTRPVLSLTRFHYAVGERAGHVRIVVQRAGRTTRAVTVRYTARADTQLRSHAGPRDFRKTSGILRFGAGERRASFRVPIIDDSRPEQGEKFVVVLRRPGSPAALGTPNMALVRIRANDGGSGQ